MALIVVIQNKTELAKDGWADYEYQVLVGDGTLARSRVLASGKVKRHYRPDGWLPLVRRVLEAEGGT